MFFLLESIYRRGARRWRKLYCANGHTFQAKRFNRVRLVGYLKPCYRVVFYNFNVIALKKAKGRLILILVDCL